MTGLGAVRPRGNRPLVQLVVAALIALTVGVAHSPSATADTLEVNRTRNQAGPLGAITVIGDSVLLGSVLPEWGPNLDDRLLEAGWGPVRVRAGVGDRTGASGGNPVTVRADYWIERWRSEGWDAPAVVVNLGANESDDCGTTTSCHYRTIMHLVDVIGDDTLIWWPKITRHPVQRPVQNAFNAALDRVASEQSTFFTWDWPTVMYEIGKYEWDHIHQTADGYRERSVRMARHITASLAQATQVGGPAPLPDTAGPKSAMQPVGPTRVLDTRRDDPGRLGAGATVEVELSAAGLPGGTSAVAAYITAAGPSADGHLSAHDCAGGAPPASFVNYGAGVNRGAVTIAPLSSGGTLCITTHAATDIIVDVQAAFVPTGASNTQRFTPLATPDRVLDTRQSGRSRELTVQIPNGGGIGAVAVNLTAVNGSADGHITAFPCGGDVPTVANVNYLAGEVVASAAYVPVSSNGTICLSTHSPVDVVVDLTGTFKADGQLVFQPAVPTRMLDTRRAIGGWAPIHGAGQTLDARVAPAGARAVTGTITLVNPVSASHLQAWACGDRDSNSNVNAPPGGTRANFVTTGVRDGRLCINAINPGHTVFDTTGWWVVP